MALVRFYFNCKLLWIYNVQKIA